MSSKNKQRQTRKLIFTRLTSKIASTIVIIILIVLSFVTIYPVFFTANSSFKDPTQWSRSKFALPRPMYYENYTIAWKRSMVLRTTLNSIIVTCGGVILCFLVCILAAYSATKLRFRGRDAIFIFIIASMMVPLQVILYPFFKIMSEFQLTDTYIGLILAYSTFGISITVYQFSAYLKRIPNSLIEAAKIDGASTLKIIFNIIVPVAKPVVVTASIINFSWMWNELLLPTMLIQGQKMQTVIVSLALMRGQWGAFPTLISAGVIIGILPVSIVYFIAQNQIIKGMTTGSVSK
jgi:ABC-type glycerol-3-phosphate transport system permease component